MIESECEDDACGVCGIGGSLLIKVGWWSDTFYLCRDCVRENKPWFNDIAQEGE
jgi:hypothetical protein